MSDILGDNVDKLSYEENQNLEGNITYTKILHSLKQMKNEKSPGLDGYTAEFYYLFCRFRNFCFKINQLWV